MNENFKKVLTKVFVKYIIHYIKILLFMIKIISILYIRHIFDIVLVLNQMPFCAVLICKLSRSFRTKALGEMSFKEAREE